MPNEVRSSSWCQGQVLPDEAVGALNLASDSKAEFGVVAVVITHDCDLVNNREPYVEVIVGRRIGATNGNFTHGKSPRTLHLGFCLGGGAVSVELQARNKKQLGKKDLADYAPNATWSLDADNLSILQRWLASRYRRAAFPDAFEACLRNARLDRTLANTVEPLGALVRAVYFDVTESGTAESLVYELDIVLVYDAYHVNGLAQAEEADRAIEETFLQRLDNGSNPNTHAIDFRSCRAISDEALTYKQSLELKQWRLDYLSLRDDPQQNMPE